MPSNKRATVAEEEDSSFNENKKPRTQRRKSPPRISEEEKRNYTLQRPYPQQFSFPENIVYYFARNPKSIKCHQKLMKTGKLLVRMSRIIPVENVYGRGRSVNDVDFVLSHKSESINIKYENFIYKLWIQNTLKDHISQPNPNFISLLTPRIYRCSLYELRLTEQVLSFNELEILTSGNKFKEVSFHENIIKNNDGTITDFAQVFEALFCERMKITLPQEQHGIGRYTSNKMFKILQEQGNEYDIYVYNIPEIFDIQALPDFVKANLVGRHHDLDFWFVDTLSDAYRNQLQQLVDEIIQLPESSVLPVINFSGKNIESFRKLIQIYEARCGTD